MVGVGVIGASGSKSCMLGMESWCRLRCVRSPVSCMFAGFLHVLFYNPRMVVAEYLCFGIRRFMRLPYATVPLKP